MVGGDVETFGFNTAISAVMELFNTLSTATDPEARDRAEARIAREAIETILVLLSPMIPHFCAEMWEQFGNPGSVEQIPWPQYDAKAAAEDRLTIVVQVRGKVRSRLDVPADIDDDELTRLALSDENVLRYIGGATIKKTIVVKKKLVNIVV